MDIKDIRKIIDLMKENELTEFELQDEGFRVAIKRRNGNGPQVTVSAPAGVSNPAGVPLPAGSVSPAGLAAPSPDARPEGEGLVPIKSPMVGTFYRAPSPDADPFVAVGAEVEEDTVVCIVEAMKVMNEIKAETTGIIRKILVDNTTPVQFGQPLFLVEPS